MRCVIYKSLRRFDYYLYVRQEEALSRVPESLKQLLGSLEQVMEVDLDATRRLAQADVRDVMQQIVERGYYLQMPPGTVPGRPEG